VSAPFREVTREAFETLYLRHGPASGWTASQWETSFAQTPAGWRFMVQAASSPEHDRMWIVTDHTAREHRLFFMTEESTEDVFDHPGRD
jgi:hypothetical protein